MPISKTMTRRMDDVSVIHWDMASDGSDIRDWIIGFVPVDWTVRHTLNRTINVSDPTGEEGFNVDRGEYLVVTSDDKIIKTSAETLTMFFV